MGIIMKKKRILLEELFRSGSGFGSFMKERNHEITQEITYDQQYDYIMKLIEEEKVKPLKASGTNGKSPALYREYWLMGEKKDYRHLEEELKYQMVPLISIDYYLAHLSVYEKDRSWVLKLNDYFKNHREKLDYQESVNERSFEIWCREKFLTKEQGRRILRCCGLDLEVLNVYETSEPLAYYSHTREVPQNILILENKDTFYSMRRLLLEGDSKILGVQIGTLIYGAGKGILRSFKDFDFCVEPYMRSEKNSLFYFGDLDYEGIGIYEGLVRMFQGSWRIRPFLPGYLTMIEKAEAVEKLPDTKELQNRNISKIFLSYFKNKQVDKILKILESDAYIPQEILNIADLSRG